MADTNRGLPARAARFAGWVVLGGALATAGAALLPLEPSFPSLSIDDSFAATLHYAAAHPGAAPGLISTYGPLGFAFFALYLPETFTWLVVLQAALALVIVWVLAWLGWAAWRSPWGPTLAIGAVAPLLAVPDARFAFLSVLAILVELPRDRRAPVPMQLALGAAIGVAALIKVTFLLAAVVVVSATTVALQRRRLPYLGLGAVVAALIGSAVLRLGGADWLAYLDWSVREIVPGYAAAMQVPSPPGLVVDTVAVAVAIWIAATVLARQRTGARWWALSAAVAAWLFILFKAGFVRADSHVFITIFALLAVAILLALLWAASLPRAVIAIAVVAALPGALLWHGLARRGLPPSVLSPAHVLTRLRTLPDMLFTDALARTYEQRTAELRETLRRPLPTIDGTVDVYSYQQSLALALGLDLRPRPVFHGYMAYTPRLAHANAEHVAAADGPRWILFEPATIDRRVPALDDAPTIPLLLSGYRAIDAIGRFALLERLPSPLPWRLDPLGSAHTTTDAPVEVPGGLVWARIAVAESIGDRVVTALFTGPYLFMDATFADGTSSRYRLVSAIARDGFLLSPLIATASDVATLMQHGAGAMRPRTVVRFRIRVESPFGTPWEPRAVDVELFQLTVGDPAGA